MQYLDGQNIMPMLKNGAKKIELEIERINSLNVFPVPDGDTGTNMCLTINGGISDITNEDEKSIGKLFKKISKYMVMSARGNSGVILSQFFKGFADAVAEKEVIDKYDLVTALNSGTKRSYKVVQVPTEGTILTIMREAGTYVEQNINDYQSIEDVLLNYTSKAKISLENTPNLLPCLKDAGVIDSGGAGFVTIFEGMLEALDGKLLDDVKLKVEDLKIVGDYYLEFTLNISKKYNSNDIIEMKKQLNTLSEIIEFNENNLNVRLNTSQPSEIIKYCLQFGDFINLQMKPNKKIEINDTFCRQYKKYAIVAVASGEGIEQSLKDLGVDEIIKGGQTMNPSSEDFVHAFEKLNSDYILVFPNNKNIFMAAEQACSMYSKAKAYVINSYTIDQCYSALTMLDFSSDNLNEIVNNLESVINNVTSLAITYAIRDCVIDNLKINKGDCIALVNGNIVAANCSVSQTFKDMLNKVVNLNEKEVMTLIYGKEMKEQDKSDIRNYLTCYYPNIEIGEIEGGQDIYYLFASLE